VFSWLEEFLNGYRFAQAAECEPASVFRLNGCCTSFRNSSQDRHVYESVQLKLKEAVPGGEEGVEQRQGEADQYLNVQCGREDID
jgi:hypothetical protein